jgi:aspartate dehydrogenase
LLANAERCRLPHKYSADNGVDIDRLDAPLKLFEGTAREAGKGFPANLNVAVALSLAGIDPDRTMLEIWADPGVTRTLTGSK